MAGFGNVYKLIPATQEGIDPGELLIETGIATYSSTGTDVAVRTQLTEILGGIAVPFDLTSLATDAAERIYQHFVNRTISSGAFSIYRSSQSAISAAPVFYIVVGKHYDTN